MKNFKVIMVGVFMLVFISGARGTPYYVDGTNGNDSNDGSSWEEAFVTIQKGLDTVSTGDIIDVNAGTYYETIDFNGVSCTLKSTDADDDSVVAGTIIDANGGARAVYFHTSEDANSVLSGFTITGGLRGIMCSGASPTINKCVITGNDSRPNHGGGMHNGSSSSPVVDNCLFVDNDANIGGGIYNTSSSPTVTNCIFSGNAASLDGGGIANVLSSPAISGCSFVGNDAVAKGGGLFNLDSDPIVTDCVFARNAASAGGGVLNRGGSSPELTNCTFTLNSATSDGGGMASSGATTSPMVTNCIFWGNQDSDSNEVFKVNGADPNFAYCDIKDSNGSGANWDSSLGSDGGGNIDSDPCFVDADSNDFHLRPNSACIDAGDPNGSYAGQTDIDGADRVVTGDLDDVNVVDIGADEFKAELWILDGSDTYEAVFNDLGDVFLRGTFESSSAQDSNDSLDEFIIEDSDGNEVAIIDANNGHMYIDGSLFEWQDTFDLDGTNHFIIENSDGDTLAYIDDPNGDLYLMGALYEQALN